MRGKPLRSTVQTIWVALEPGPQLLGDAPVKLLITCTSEKEPFSYFPSERLPLAEISIPSHGTATISISTPQIRAFPLFWTSNRKHVVEGKRVSVRVDNGGDRV